MHKDLDSVQKVRHSILMLLIQTNDSHKSPDRLIEEAQKLTVFVIGGVPKVEVTQITPTNPGVRPELKLDTEQFMKTDAVSTRTIPGQS